MPSSFYMKPPEILLGRIKIFQCFRQNFTQKYPNRDIIAVITSRLNQELDITGLPSSFYMTPSEIFIRNNKNISMFSLEFHSKISKSWYYCCNYITTKSATRHNRFASFILNETSRNFTRKNKNISMFLLEFHSKISTSWYYCCNYITTKSATRHNRFASFILNETSRNFTRKN